MPRIDKKSHEKKYPCFHNNQQSLIAKQEKKKIEKKEKWLWNCTIFVKRSLKRLIRLGKKEKVKSRTVGTKRKIRKIKKDQRVKNQTP